MSLFALKLLRTSFTTLVASTQTGLLIFLKILEKLTFTWGINGIGYSDYLVSLDEDVKKPKKKKKKKNILVLRKSLSLLLKRRFTFVWKLSLLLNCWLQT